MPGNIYRDFISSELQPQDTNIRPTLSQAVEVDPTREAKLRQFAREANLPPAVASALGSSLDQEFKVNRVDQDTAQTPVTRQAYGDPEFANLAHDDSAPLSGLEKALLVPRAVLSAVPAFVQGYAGITAPIYGLAAERGKSIREGRALPGVNPATAMLGPGGAAIMDGLMALTAPLLQGESDFLAATADRAETAAKAVAGPSGGDVTLPFSIPLVGDRINPGGLVQGAAQSVGQSLPGIIASVLSGGAATPGIIALGLAPGVITQGGMAAQDARKKGLSSGEQLSYGASQGAIEAVTEYVPALRFFGDIKAGSSLGKIVLDQITSDVPGEVAATLGQNLNEWATLNPDKPFKEFLAEQPRAVVETVLQTMIAGGMTGALGSAAVSLTGGAKRRQEQAQAGQRDAQFLDRLAKLAEASALRERAPDVFADLVQRQAEAHGAPEAVYVTPEAFNQTFATPEGQEALRSMPQAVQDAVEQATQTGGDVRIPISEFTTHVAPTPLYAQLQNDIKLDPNGLTRTEAEDFIKNESEQLRADIEAVLAKTELDEATNADRERLRATLKNQLDKTSRFTSDVNDLYASFAANSVAAVAARAGKTIDELLAENPLFVNAGDGQVIGAETLNNTNAEGGGIMPEGGRDERGLPEATGRQQTQTGAVPQPGAVRGGTGLLDDAPGPYPGDDTPLVGLPRRIRVGDRVVKFGPHAPARQAARRYAEQAGLPYNPPTRYVRADPVRGKLIAEAFEAMEHRPNDPDVRAAYDAMIAETIAQWEAIKATGLQVSFNKNGVDPYAENPRLAIIDVVENNHLSVFPTEEGFGEILLNVGLADPQGGADLTVERVLEVLESVGGVPLAHIVHPSDTEPTAIVRMSRALTKEQGDRLSEELGQEAIAQLAVGEGNLFGPMSEDWGPFNPELFFMMDGRRASEAGTLADNPLLRLVEGEVIDGRVVCANDIFRIVHDYFGHIAEGNGFRADGEENAWRAHSAMYSPLARKAMTTETRGQNSWVNFGPFGEQNQTANGADTVYAPQKIGLLPDWVVNEDATDDPLEAPMRTDQPGVLYQQGVAYDPGLGLRSAVFDYAQEKGPGRASAAQWLATLAKAPGVKAEELEWMGLKEGLEVLEDENGGQVSKEQVLNYIAKNGVHLVETVNGENIDEDPWDDPEFQEIERELMDRAWDEEYEKPDYDVLLGYLDAEYRVVDAADYDREIHDDIEEGAEPRWFVIDGSDQYGGRWGVVSEGGFEDEVTARGEMASLLESHHQDAYERWEVPEWVSEQAWEEWSRNNGSSSQWSEYALPGGDNYREFLLSMPREDNPRVEDDYAESHFNKPNIIAHFRTKDRTDDNGAEHLHLGETQSSLHQAGRKKGYKTAPDPAKMRAAEAALDEAAAAFIDETDQVLNDIAPQMEAWRDFLDVKLAELQKRAEEAETEQGVALRAMQEAQAAVDEASRRGALATSGEAQPPAAEVETYRRLYREWQDQSALARRRSSVLADAVMARVALDQLLRAERAGTGEGGAAFRWDDLRDARRRLSDLRDDLVSGEGYDFTAVADAIKRLAVEGGVTNPGRPSSYLLFAEARSAYLEAASPSGIPNFPFKGDAWATLVLKRAIRIAVAEDKQAVSWIFGNQQNGWEDAAGAWFYNRNLVNIANALLKKYGAKVELMPFKGIGREPRGERPAFQPFTAAGIEAEFAGRIAAAQSELAALKEKALAAGADKSNLQGTALTAFYRESIKAERSQELLDALSALKNSEERLAELSEQKNKRLSANYQWGFYITPELRAAVEQDRFTLFQEARGTFTPSSGAISLLRTANLSTFLHEFGHWHLETLARLASGENAPPQIRQDFETVLRWFGITGDETPTGGDQGGALAQPSAPSLTPAIRHNGKVYKGASHLDALLQIADPQERQRASLDGNNRVYVTDRGRVLDRYKAQEYARTWSLFSDDAPSWVPGARELASEYLKPPAFDQGGALAQADTQVVDARGRPLTVYHGTVHKFDTFRPGRAGGIYFTPSPEHAGGYGSRIVAAQLKVNRLADLTDPASDAYRIAVQAFNESGGWSFNEDEMEDRDTPDFDPETDHTWEMFDEGGARVADALRAAGYDGLKLGEFGDQVSYVVFDPAQIEQAPLAQGGEETPVAGPPQLPAGRTPLDVWNAMSLEEKRPYHEKFARGFEAYLFEGRAPSVELRGIFQRFAAWMKSVYRDLVGLNVELTDEVRSVMDRLVATPEQIKAAEGQLGIAQAFAQKPDTMTNDEWEAYQRLGLEATTAAVDELQTRLVRDLRFFEKLKARALRDLKREVAEQRKAVRAEVRAEVMAEPVNRARQFLRRGTDADGNAVEGAGKLDAVAVSELYGDTPAELQDWKNLGFGRFGMLAKEGLNPDDVAERFGYGSGQALIEDLLNAENANEKIEGLTDQRMLERYGDITSPEGLERAATEAVHNEAMARLLTTEYNVLAKAVGGRKMLNDEARSLAKQLVGRLMVKDLKPDRYLAAERRAAKAAEEAIKANDLAAAAAHKRAQIINFFAARAVKEAQREVRKGQTLFSRIVTARNEGVSRSRDRRLVDAARAILAAYGLDRARNSVVEAMELVKSYSPDVYALVEPTLIAATANAKPIAQVTVDDFVALADTVKQLWALSRLSRQMTIEGRKVSLDEARQAILGQLAENPPSKLPSGVSEAPSKGARFLRALSGLRASLRRVESWVQLIDGGTTGAWRTYVWQPISEAADAYRVARNDVLRRLVDILAAVGPTLRRGKIDAREIGYTFGGGNGGVGKAELLHALLHTGNESNKRKLLLGRGWATESNDVLDTSRWDAFLDRMHRQGVITQADWDFCQRIWDLLDELKPAAQGAHFELFGRYFSEVTADTVSTPFGQYRGGYVPALTDDWMVGDRQLQNEEDLLRNSDATMFPAPAKGFTMKRVEDYTKPLALDLGILARHVDQVLKFSHLAVPTRDALRLLRTPAVGEALQAVDPTAMSDLLMPWLNRAAKQITETPTKGVGGKAIDNFFRLIRARTGMALMVGNVVNALQQTTGLSVSAVLVKPRYLTASLWTYLRDPKGSAQAAADLSEFMATRTSQAAYEARAQLDELLLDPTRYEKLSDWADRHAYALQTWTQGLVDTITWQAAYAQAIDDGQSEREAVRFADSVVRQTQGSFAAEDVSRAETGAPLTRALMQFYSYFNGQSNLLGTEFAQASRDGDGSRAAWVYLTGIMLPAVLAELIKKSLAGEWDDDDDNAFLMSLLDLFFGSQARYVAGLVPVAGAFVMSGIERLFTGQTRDDRVGSSPAATTLSSAVGTPAAWYRVVTKDGQGLGDAVRDTLSLVTLSFGGFAGAVAAVARRPAGYTADVIEGKVNPTGPMDFARGLVTGRASPASKE